MPRCVRNFWVEVNSDARAKAIGTGPVSKDGRMKIRLFVREKGKISDLTLAVECVPFSDEQGVRKNRVIAYFDGPAKDLEKVEVRPEAKQITFLVEA